MGLTYFKTELRYNKFFDAVKHLIFDRPELSITSIDIKNANPDLSNQINVVFFEGGTG